MLVLLIQVPRTKFINLIKSSNAMILHCIEKLISSTIIVQIEEIILNEGLSEMFLSTQSVEPR